MPKIPSLALDKKGTCQVHELGPYLYKKKYLKKKGEGIPSLPSSVLVQQSNYRVPDPGPTVRLVGTMAQDSVRKREKRGKKIIVSKGNKQIHMLLREIRSNLETQTLRNSFKMQRSSLETQTQIYEKKK